VLTDRMKTVLLEMESGASREGGVHRPLKGAHEIDMGHAGARRR
jgi:hypothetical protein